MSKALGWPLSALCGAVAARKRCAHAGLSCQQYMARTVTDARLRGVLCALWGDYGLRPDSVTFMQHALVAGNNFEGVCARPELRVCVGGAWAELNEWRGAPRCGRCGCGRCRRARNQSSPLPCPRP